MIKTNNLDIPIIQYVRKIKNKQIVLKNKLPDGYSQNKAYCFFDYYQNALIVTDKYPDRSLNIFYGFLIKFNNQEDIYKLYYENLLYLQNDTIKSIYNEDEDKYYNISLFEKGMLSVMDYYVVNLMSKNPQNINEFLFRFRRYFVSYFQSKEYQPKLIMDYINLFKKNDLIKFASILIEGNQIVILNIFNQYLDKTMDDIKATINDKKFVNLNEVLYLLRLYRFIFEKTNHYEKRQLIILTNMRDKLINILKLDINYFSFFMDIDDTKKRNFLNNIAFLESGNVALYTKYKNYLN